MSEDGTDRSKLSQGDEELLALVAEALKAVDPIPSSATRAAEVAFAWRSNEADIATLFECVSDSVPTSTGVRASGDERFEWESTQVRVAGDWLPDGSLVGRVTPFDEGTVTTLEIQSGSASIEVAVGGRFVIRSGGKRSVVRVLVTQGGSVTATEWFVIDP